MQADAVHLSAEDPSGLSSHVRLVVVVAAGRNDPPQVHVPGANYVEEPCDSRTGRIGNPSPQHPAAFARQCRRITDVDQIHAYEDTIVALKGVYIEDSDVNEAGMGAQIDVEVEAQHGSFGFPEESVSPPGVFFLPDGDYHRGNHLLSIRGALDHVNTALATLTYIPDPDWSGSDEVVVRANDRGFTGSGGAGTDSQIIPVVVASQNDAPLILVTAAGGAGAGGTAPPPPLEMLEDSRVVLHNFTLYDADVNPRDLHGQILGVASNTPYEEYPADVNGGQFEVTVTVENGRFFFPRTAGLAFEPPSTDSWPSLGNGGQAMEKLNQGAKFASSASNNLTAATNRPTGRWDVTVPWWREARFTGRLHDCNLAISAMTYWPNINWNGVDRVHVSVVESQPDAPDGDAHDAETSSFYAAENAMFVRVMPVNDAPVVTPPSPRYHTTLRTGDLLSPTATHGNRVFVPEDGELLLPGFVIRDVDLTDNGGENALMTVTVTCQHGKASITWHGSRVGVGPGDSRHPLEESSLGADLTGLLFLDETSGGWAPWGGSMGAGATTFTFRALLADANAALQSLAFEPTEDFFGNGAWVKVEAFDEGLLGRSIDASEDSMFSATGGTASVSARGVATVPVTILAVNDAPRIVLPFSEDMQAIVRLDEEEERRLDGARWHGSFAAAVQASAYFPLRKGMELWRSQGVFPRRDAGRWGKASQMEWKGALVGDLNEGLGDGSPSHFIVWGDVLYFQVGGERARRSGGEGKECCFAFFMRYAKERTQLAGSSNRVLVRARRKQKASVRSRHSGLDCKQICLIILNQSRNRRRHSIHTNGTLMHDPHGFALYQATDEYHGAELWKTDGTGAGTVLVKDIYPGEESGAPKFLTPFGDYLYFQVPAEGDTRLALSSLER